MRNRGWLVLLLALAGVLLLQWEFPLAGWLLLLLAALAAVATRPRGVPTGPTAVGADADISRGDEPIRAAEWVGLGLLVVVAAALRLYRLGTMPPGCWFDEAENGLETLRVLGGELFFFTPRNNGRGALQFYWVAPFFRAFGPSLIALRLSSALAGILTIPAAWALFRRLSNPSLALAAAAFLAVSRWHLTASRIGFDVVLTPLFDILALYAVVRAIRSGSWVWFALSGALAGAANYGYTASRATPLIVVAAYAVLLAGTPMTRRRSLGLVVAAGIFALSIAPLGLYALRHERAFVQRTRQVNIASVVVAERSLAPVVRELSATLRMLHERGDENPRHNLPGSPMLDPVAGLALVLGLVWGRRSAERRCFQVLIAWTSIALLLGGVLTVRAPHANRTISALAPICLLAALGARAAFVELGVRGRARTLAWIAMIAASVTLTIRSYFIVYASRPELGEAFMAGAARVGDYVGTIDPTRPVWVWSGFNPSVVAFVSRRDARVLHFMTRKEPGLQDFATGIFVVPTDAELPPELSARPHRATRIAPPDAPSFEAVEFTGIPAGSSDSASGVPPVSPPGGEPHPL